MAEDKVNNIQERELSPPGFKNVQVNLSLVFEKVRVFKMGQKITTSLPGSPEPVKEDISHKVCSQGGHRWQGQNK